MDFWQDMLDGYVSGTTPERLANQKLGLQPALSAWRPGFVEKHWPVDPELFHGRALFGGYIAAMADQVLGLAAMTVLEDESFFGTTNMAISYLAPVTGGELRVEGAVIRQRTRSIYVECTFYCDEEIVAKASATQVIYANTAKGGLFVTRTMLSVSTLRDRRACMTSKIFEALTEVEQRALDEMRAWAAAQGSGEEFRTVAGKLAIVRRAIANGVAGPLDAWKLNALGVLFGDALAQAMEERLRWVIAEDSVGPSYALSWKQSEVLIYPMSAIRSRVQDRLPVDVHAMFHEISSILPFSQR